MEEENIFNRYQLEDLEYCLLDIEKMYKIKFNEEDFKKVKTFNDYCDVVINKIPLEDKEDCTSQQAFYKLRNWFLGKGFISSKHELTLDTLLSSIFPRKNRVSNIKILKKDLNLSSYLLTISKFHGIFLFIIFLSTLVSFFI